MEKIVFGITGLTLGGAERVLVDLANELSKNYEITIFTICWQYLNMQSAVKANASEVTQLQSELNELTNDDVAGVLKVSTQAVDYALQSDRRKYTLSLQELYNTDTENGYWDFV